MAFVAHISRSIGLLAVLFAAGATPALAESCRNAADAIVKTETTELLQQVVKNDPQLGQLDEATLVIEGGKTLLEAPQPDFKARGWLMLMWYGGQTGRDIVAQSSETLTTEADRAHLYFAMGLFQLSSKKPATAAEGRKLLSQVKDTGKVTFVPDEMWAIFLETCELPEA
jgi:hypothetical protein